MEVLNRGLIRVYADVENAVGMPPQKLRQHVLNTYGSSSTNFAFLARRNRQALIRQWQDAGFQVCFAGEGTDAADHRLISSVVRDIERDAADNRSPGTLVIVATGDGVYRDVLKLASRLGWTTVVIGWGELSSSLRSAAMQAIDLAACAN